MNGRDSLEYYLKGALAGKMIESPARVGECRQCSQNLDPQAAVSVKVPKNVTVGCDVNVCVRINNFLQHSGTGRIVLQGEDLERGATYDFQASFSLKYNSPGSCITFRWRAPRYATRIRWSATIHIEDKMGLGLSDCSETTTVSLPLH